ncbi:MAG: hypothetical protein JWM82_1983, partial [Myxococcales bacterium]|nr:hypothetical protein [Myxococcales bacterium]
AARFGMGGRGGLGGGAGATTFTSGAGLPRHATASVARASAARGRAAAGQARDDDEKGRLSTPEV